jgi:hypothetical protein
MNAVEEAEIAKSLEGRIAPPRPKFLGEFLDAQAMHFTSFDDKYFSFLQCALDSMDEQKHSPVNVEVVLKVNKKLGTDPHVKHEAAINNASANDNFAKIFQFYSTFGESVEGSTFEDISEGANTWSHSELEVFLRDLNVIPKLLSREDMRTVWEDATNARIQNFDKVLVQLRLEDAKEIMVRIALFVYMRAGMKRMILATTGSFPSPRNMVQCLIAYMRIDDTDFINEHIREGTGRTSQGKLNYVSHLETKTINKEHFDRDMQYKAYRREEIKTKLDQKKKDKIEEKAKVASAKAEAKAFHGRPRPENMKQDSDEHIPDSIRVMLAAPQPKVEKEKESRPSTADKDSKSTTESAAAETTEMFISAKNTPLTDRYDQHYEELLLKEFDMYCQTPLGNAHDPDQELSRAPFLDAGHLSTDTNITVFVNVTNSSAHELDIDIIPCNFEEENNARVITRPGLLAPGITRQFQVTLTTGSSVQSVVGCFEVGVQNHIHGYSDTVSIPFFFYTGPYTLLGGEREPAPVKGPTIKARHTTLLRERLAAGMMFDDGFGASFSAEDSFAFADVSLAHESQGDSSTVSSLRMGSTLGGFSMAGGKDKGNRLGEDPSLAAALSADFSRDRSSWYKVKSVGGGGRTLGAYSKGRFSAGSGASVASSLRAASTNGLRSLAGSLQRPGTMSSINSRKKRDDASSLFGDGDVMAFE